MSRDEPPFASEAGSSPPIRIPSGRCRRDVRRGADAGSARTFPGTACLVARRLSAVLASQWRRRIVRTSFWALLAAVVPLVARAHLIRRVDSELEPAIARTFDIPIRVGSLDATVTGLVQLRDVSAGSAMSADLVEAAFDPFAIAAGDLEPTEIGLVNPHIRLAEGGIWEPLRRRLSARGRVRPGSRSGPHLRHLIVTGGVLVVDFPGGVTARATGVEMRPHRNGARVVTGPVELAWRSGPAWAVEARFARAAADIEADGAWRVLAIAGEGMVGERGGHPLRLVTSTIRGGGAGGLGELDLRGRVADEDRGKLALALSLDRQGGVRRARASVQAVPLGFLAPIARSWGLLEAARATGEVHVGRDGEDITATGRLAVDGVLVAHPLISMEPVAVDGSVAGRVHLRRLAGRQLVSIDDVQLRRANVTVDAHGLLEWADNGAEALVPERAELTVTLPETPCDQALAAVPIGLRTHLAGFDVDGTVSGSIALAFDRSNAGATNLDTVMDLRRCRVAAEPALADPMRVARPFDLQLPDGGTVRVGEGLDHVALATLPRHVVGAFVAAEDARFFQHDGFDPDQIERSLGIDLDSGRLLRGGSTISQQLVKNVYLSPDRTMARKLEEAVLTWRLEARVDKRIILERYLNLIELGADIHGIGPAARYWFATSAAKLGVRQAAFLAALTPAPRTLSRIVHEHGGVDSDLAGRVDIVLRAMRVSRVIDRATYERARREQLHLAPAALGRR